MRVAPNLLLTALVVLVACSAAAREEQRYSGQGRYKGYTKDVGDRTEEYTPWGQETGYSRTIGDREYDFTPDGKKKGHSETFGDITYESGAGGRVKGYNVKPGDEVSRSDEDITPGAPSAEEADRAFNSGGATGVWGFSGPGQENGD
jgi:hypothetical protein